jgi:hypothetical protein
MLFFVICEPLNIPVAAAALPPTAMNSATAPSMSTTDG